MFTIFCFDHFLFNLIFLLSSYFKAKYYSGYFNVFIYKLNIKPIAYYLLAFKVKLLYVTGKQRIMFFPYPHSKQPRF